MCFGAPLTPFKGHKASNSFPGGLFLRRPYRLWHLKSHTQSLLLLLLLLFAPSNYLHLPSGLNIPHTPSHTSLLSASFDPVHSVHRRTGFRLPPVPVKDLIKIIILITDDHKRPFPIPTRDPIHKPLHPNNNKNQKNTASHHKYHGNTRHQKRPLSL